MPWALRLFRTALVVGLTAGMTVVMACSSSAQPQPATWELLRLPPPRVLPIPVDGVTHARLIHSWGSARDGGRSHKGIDIFAPRWTPVRSATDGVIVDKALRGLGGRYVSVLGPGGYRHYYAHLEEWAGQQVGDRVQAGEILGFVGNSGNAAVSATHLHYGIYAPGGDAIDPYPLLQGDPFVLNPPPPAPLPVIPVTSPAAG